MSPLNLPFVWPSFFLFHVDLESSPFLPDGGALQERTDLRYKTHEHAVVMTNKRMY